MTQHRRPSLLRSGADAGTPNLPDHLELTMNQTDPTAARFRHRTAEVDAVQWTGSNADQLIAFAPDRFATAAPEDRIDPEDDALVLIEESHWVAIRPGCWVLKYPDHFAVESDADFREWYEPAPVVAPPTDRAADEADADAVANRAAQVITSMGADIRTLTNQRDRYRTAWRSARERAQAYGEGILRVVKDRESYQEWLCQAEEHNARLRRLAVEAHDTGTQQPSDEDVVEAHRLALSEALHLGNAAPWDAILDRAGDLSRRDVEAQQQADRPFRDEPTEVLRHALALASVHASQAARFRPQDQDGALPAVADLFQAELQHREGEPPADQAEDLVHVGWWCWRGDNHGHLATMACRSDNVPIHVPAEWADEMRAVIQRIEDGDDVPAPVAQQPAGFVNPHTGTGMANGGNWSAQQAAAADGEETPVCPDDATPCTTPGGPGCDCIHDGNKPPRP